MNKHAAFAFCLLLPVLFGSSLLLWTGCGFPYKADSTDESKDGDRERQIIRYLGSIYEQPLAGTWQEGKVYFLPQKSKVDALGEVSLGANLGQISVYKSSIWILHWGPEEFPVLVWDVEVNGGAKLGVLEGPEDIVEKLPGILDGLKFSTNEERHDLAMLLAEMVHAFYPRKLRKSLRVSSEGSCEVAELTTSDEWIHTVGACFTKEGSLESVILRQAR